MTIKNTVYSIHQSLKELTNPPLKLTHVYELLAAAFGFNSHASLKSVAIIMQLNEPFKTSKDSIIYKATLLGYEDFPPEKLMEKISDEGLSMLTFEELATKLRENEISVEDELDQISVAQSNSWANYCLALHYAEEEDETQVGSEYWYNQMLAGRSLSGHEKTFALEYQKHLEQVNKYVFHLRKAASLGCDLALLDLAEKFNDLSFFKGNHQKVAADPMRVAEIAENLGRNNNQHRWLTIAAESGNTDAMRELIEGFDSKNLTRCWTWIYLSQKLEKDLTQDRYFAIHENGSSYDDDIGGPMYADGIDGVDLPSLEIHEDRLAKLSAESIFNQMQFNSNSR